MKAMIFCSAILSMFFSCTTAVADEKLEKPNIIFIMVDDLGPEWVGCYGADAKLTPNIDQLAATGMKFQTAWSMPQCTPTRVTLLTGQYPFRHGWINHWDVPRWGGQAHFDERHNPSFAVEMRKAGYATCAAGKWQIDDFRVEPDAMVKAGFDDYCMWTGYETGNPPSGKRYYDPYLHTKSGSKTYKGKFGEDVFTDFIIDFMKKNKDKPMMIYYPMAITHGPLTRTPASPNVKGPMQKHQAMVRYTDQMVGKIVKAVDDLGIRKNTIVIFTTDNGTSRGLTGSIRGRKMKGGKGLTTNSGIHQPFVVNWPGTIPAGAESKALLDFTDIHPTFLDFAGTKPNSKWKIDGHSLKDVMLGKDKEGPRKWILAMGGQPGKRTEKGVENKFTYRDRAIANKKYKLLVGKDKKPEALYDNIKDPGETKNLLRSPVAEHRAAIQELMAVIKSLPQKDNNPRYTPNPVQKWDVPVGFGTKKRKGKSGKKKKRNRS